MEDKKMVQKMIIATPTKTTPSLLSTSMGITTFWVDAEEVESKFAYTQYEVQDPHLKDHSQ